MKYALGGNAWEGRRRSRVFIILGAGVLVLVSAGIFALIVRGSTRVKREQVPVDAPVVSTTSTETLIARRLDGMIVPKGHEALPVFAVTVENQVDARPLSGISKAQVVFEFPVEGGITRFLALYDASTTVVEIGPVRSARPYFVEMARAWNASYFHVGGSPQALEQLKTWGSSLLDADEYRFASSFRRSSSRAAPHNVYTSDEKMNALVVAKGFSSSTAALAWHFQDGATTTERGTDGQKISIPYGGSYNVTWAYNKEKNNYKRYQAGRIQKDADGSEVESENVIVMKASAQVMDSVGRLLLKTTSGGDAVAYRDGKKFALRWSRAQGEPLRFEGTDGTEFLLARGKTWIEVAIDDKIFAGSGN
jgi:hypothetical protein